MQLLRPSIERLPMLTWRNTARIYIKERAQSAHTTQIYATEISVMIQPLCPPACAVCRRFLSCPCCLSRGLHKAQASPADVDPENSCLKTHGTCSIHNVCSFWSCAAAEGTCEEMPESQGSPADAARTIAAREAKSLAAMSHRLWALLIGGK